MDPVNGSRDLGVDFKGAPGLVAKDPVYCLYMGQGVMESAGDFNA